MNDSEAESILRPEKPPVEGTKVIYIGLPAPIFVMATLVALVAKDAVPSNEPVKPPETLNEPVTV